MNSEETRVCSMCGTPIKINEMMMLAMSQCACRTNQKTDETPSVISKKEYDEGRRVFLYRQKVPSDEMMDRLRENK